MRCRGAAGLCSTPHLLKAKVGGSKTSEFRDLDPKWPHVTNVRKVRVALVAVPGDDAYTRKDASTVALVVVMVTNLPMNKTTTTR